MLAIPLQYREQTYLSRWDVARGHQGPADARLYDVEIRKVRMASCEL